VERVLRPIVLTISGSDSSGGAGLQADLKAIEANGGYAATAVTAITAQNTRCVTRVEALSAELVRAQLEAVLDDLPVAAVKSGMLAEAAVVREVAAVLRHYRPPHYVCDPVLTATTGRELLEPAAVDTLLESLLPQASLVTPNVPEAERLSGVTIVGPGDVERAARRLLELGARAVLVTGGHLTGPRAIDLLVTPHDRVEITGPRLHAPHAHGSGCALAAAIATGLARGRGLEDAVRGAKRFVAGALRHGLPLGRGTGPIDPFHEMQSRPGGRETGP
jgi:hydroxymethylpyrimidine/phosphomethylpyrimidine kinase